MAKLPTYKITIDDEYAENGELTGWAKTAFTSKPAVIIKGVAFSSQSPVRKQTFADNLKYRIAGPLIIPMEIFRSDDDGEYYVEFTEKEIEKIHKKKMANLTTNKGLFNLEHDNGETVPAYLLEVWIVENPEKDKSFSTFGIKVPKGTLFGVAQVTDKEYYKELVANEQTGFSIEGFLGMSLQEIDNKNNKKQEMKKNTKSKFSGKSRFAGKKRFEDEAIEVTDVTIVADAIEVGGEIVIIDENLEIDDAFTGELEVSVVTADAEVAEDMVIVVEDGKITEANPAGEVTEETAEVVEVEASEDEDKVKEEELSEEEDKVKEEELAEEVVETTEGEFYSKAEVDAKFDEVFKMIADLAVVEDVIEDTVEEVQLSAQDKLANLIAFTASRR